MNGNAMGSRILMLVITGFAVLGAWATATDKVDAQQYGQYGAMGGTQSYGYGQMQQPHSAGSMQAMSTAQYSDDGDDTNGDTGGYGMGGSAMYTGALAKGYGGAGAYVPYSSSRSLYIETSYIPSSSRLLWNGGAWLIAPYYYDVAPWYGGYAMGGYGYWI